MSRLTALCALAIGTAGCGPGPGPGDCSGLVNQCGGVTSVSIAPSSASVRIGQSTELRASVAVTGNAVATVSWSSSRPDVATVSANGSVATVSAVSPGSTTITATSTASPSVSGSATIDVPENPDAFQAMAVAPNQLTLLETQTGDLQASVTGLATGAAVSYQWTTSNSTVATVATIGGVGLARVTAVGPGGPAQITVTAIGSGTNVKATTRQLSVPVTVTALPNACTGVAADPRTSTLVPGQTQQITPSVAGLATGATRTFSYASSNESIVTVNTSGVMTAVSPGTATVTLTATCAGAGLRQVAPTDLVQVTVSSPPALRGLSVTPTQGTVAIGQTVTLVPTPDRATPTVVVNCTYLSSNTTVATVTSAGVVLGVSQGTSTLTVTCTGSLNGYATTVRTVDVPITVTPVANACTAISVLPGNVSIATGATQQFVATATTGGSGVVVTGTWSSSAPAIASVSTTGLMSAVTPGSATISYNASCSGTGFVTNAVTGSASALVTGSTAPAITTWTALPVGGPLQATTTRAAWSADASTWFVGGDDEVTAFGGGVWITTTGGTTWTKSLSTTQAVTAVSGQGTTNVWAGLTDGSIYQYNGSTWTQRRTGTGVGITGLYVAGTTVFAVSGVNRVEQSVGGAAFATMPAGAIGTLRLFVIAGTGPTDVYAAGDSGFVLRYTGTTWARVHTLADQPSVNGLLAFSTTSVVAGGTRCAPTCVGRLARFNGTTWTNDAALSIEFVDAMGGTSGSDVYVLNWPNEIQRYNGTTWSAIGGGSPRWNDGRTVFAPSAGVPIMVGSSRASLQRNSGGVWSTLSVLPDMYYAHAPTANAAFFVGDTRSVFRWTPGGLTTWATSSFDFLGQVFALNENDVFATTTTVNSVVRYTNGFEASTTALGFIVRALGGLPGGPVWAVGNQGGVSRFTGTTWVTETSGTLANLNTVWMGSSLLGYAGSDNGTLLRYNGTLWQTVSSPTTAPIRTIWGSDPANVFLSDANGASYRFDGAVWSIFTPLSSLIVNGGGANATTDLYVATTFGLRRVNANVLSTIALPTNGGVRLPWTLNVLTGSGMAAATGPNGSLWIGRPAGATSALQSSLRLVDDRAMQSGGGRPITEVKGERPPIGRREPRSRPGQGM